MVEGEWSGVICLKIPKFNPNTNTSQSPIRQPSASIKSHGGTTQTHF